MPPKYAKKMQRDINRYAGVLRAQRVGSFKTTTQANEGTYGNLITTTSGFAQNLTQEQSRQLGALKALRSNTNQKLGRIERGTAASVRNQYGSAVAGGMKPTALATNKAVAAAGKKAINAQAAAGGILARGNTAAMGAIQQGVLGAQAGAEALTADALAYRGKQDAATIAQQQLALDQMVLQNKLDLQNYRKKLAMEDARNNTNGAMSAVATSAASATSGLFQNFRQWIGPNGVVAWDQAHQDDNGTWVDAEGNELRPMTPSGAANQYLQDNGIDPASNEGQVVMAISRAMASGGAGTQPGAYDPAGLVNAVNQQMAILYPNFSKNQADIDALISGTLKDDVLTGTYAPTQKSSDQAIPGVPDFFQGGSRIETALNIINAPLHGLYKYSEATLKWLFG